LPNDIANCVDGSAGHKLVAVHLKVHLHAAEVGIGGVGQIEVLEEVADLSNFVSGRLCSFPKREKSSVHRGKGEQEGVHLEQQPALILRKFPCVPEIALPRFDGLHQELLLGAIGHRLGVQTIWADILI
jgi:hypothetical protein